MCWRAASRSPSSTITSRDDGAPVIWMVDGVGRVGGHPTTPWGTPRATDTDHGRAVCFDGERDGLLVDANPVEGLAAFTIEVLFRPDAGGQAAERFVHISENGG